MDIQTRHDHLPDVGTAVIVVTGSYYRLYGVISEVVADPTNPNDVTIRLILQPVPNPEPYID